MASKITLTESQQILVKAKKLPVAQRPKYFSAEFGTRMAISDDFEAFLILQGKANNKKAVDWLQQANSYSLQDSDRDSLLASFMDNEIEDSAAAAKELSPITDQFAEFRASFNVDGFEGVTEVGLFLNDVQRPMSEVVNLGARQRHRQQFASLSKQALIRRGLTKNQLKELNSWFDALTAY
jgi:hypothetical protein